MPQEPLRRHYRARALHHLHRLAAEAGRYDWDGTLTGTPVARPEQLPPPGPWHIWLMLAGRGFGKTRAGAEWVRMLAQQGRAGRMALVAPTAAAARDVMIEGESGILNISPPDFRPAYEPSRRRLSWPNGAIATLFSADEPERLRGPQHDAAWADELASWRYPAAWDMLMLGLRLGRNPRALITTTPKPITLIRELLDDPGTVVTRGSTYDNRDNLAPAFFDQIIARYEGTRLGRQELYAEIIDDVPGALWSRAMIEASRRRRAPDLAHVAIGIDPAVSHAEGADETGMIAAGRGTDGDYYILEDLSCRASPAQWAARAAAAYGRWQADRIVAEVNQGGAMVEHTLRTVAPDISFRAVRATRGKAVRAEPVAALYEQGRVHHVGGFAALEDQMCAFTPGAERLQGQSPDRVDALVWTMTELMSPPPVRARAWRL